MEIIVPKGSGFCPGVLSAEKKLFEIRENYKGIIYLSGMFIHNKEYEKFLLKKNICEVDGKILSDDPSTVFVISTHGIDKNLEEYYRKKYNVFDLTCPKVKNVQKIISENTDCLTIITGKEKHPEVIGLKSYSKEFIIVSEVDQIYQECFLHKIKNNDLLLISQTTANSDLFDGVSKFLKQKQLEGFLKNLSIHNTICPSIEKRENNSIEMLKKFNLNAIVVGDYLSSNSRRLFDKLKKIKDQIFFIEKPQDINLIIDKIKDEKKIMVVSSSSTPSFIENKIINILKNI